MLHANVRSRDTRSEVLCREVLLIAARKQQKPVLYLKQEVSKISKRKIALHFSPKRGEINATGPVNSRSHGSRLATRRAWRLHVC